jgi:hypothetical protein
MCITRRNHAPNRKEKALHNLATRLKKYNDNNACLCVRQTMIHLRFAVIRHTRKMAHFIVCRRVAQQREIYLYHFSALLCQTLTRCAAHACTLTFIVSGSSRVCECARALLINGTNDYNRRKYFCPFLLQITAVSKWYHGDREAICYLGDLQSGENGRAKKIKCSHRLQQNTGQENFSASLYNKANKLTNT